MEYKVCNLSELYEDLDDCENVSEAYKELHDLLLELKERTTPLLFRWFQRQI